MINNNFKWSFFAFAFFTLFAAFSCDKEDDNFGPGGMDDLGGTLEFSFNNTNLSADVFGIAVVLDTTIIVSDTVFLEYDNVLSFIGILSGGGADSISGTFVLSIVNYDGPKEYQAIKLGEEELGGFQTVYISLSSPFYEDYGNTFPQEESEGQVTITSDDNNRLKGTFSVDTTIGYGENEITGRMEGSFDINYN